MKNKQFTLSGSSEAKSFARMIKILCVSMFLVLSGCGGGSSDSGSGESQPGTGTGTGFEACTLEKLSGTWEITATVAGVTVTERISLDENTDVSGVGQFKIDGNNFSATEDGVTLNGTINADCTSMSGVATDLESGLSGTWTAVKL